MMCNKCSGDFTPPKGMVLSKCPFCQAELSSKVKSPPISDRQEKKLEKQKTKDEREYYRSKARAKGSGTFGSSC